MDGRTVNDLEKLAQDLAYAAARGADEISKDVISSATLEVESNVRFPTGGRSTTIGVGSDHAEVTVDGEGPPSGLIATDMAARAADDGVRLIIQGH